MNQLEFTFAIEDLKNALVKPEPGPEEAAIIESSSNILLMLSKEGHFDFEGGRRVANERLHDFLFVMNVRGVEESVARLWRVALDSIGPQELSFWLSHTNRSSELKCSYEMEWMRRKERECVMKDASDLFSHAPSVRLLHAAGHFAPQRSTLLENFLRTGFFNQSQSDRIMRACLVHESRERSSFVHAYSGQVAAAHPDGAMPWVLHGIDLGIDPISWAIGPPAVDSMDKNHPWNARLVGLQASLDARRTCQEALRCGDALNLQGI